MRPPSGPPGCDSGRDGRVDAVEVPHVGSSHAASALPPVAVCDRPARRRSRVRPACGCRGCRGRCRPAGHRVLRRCRDEPGDQRRPSMAGVGSPRPRRARRADGLPRRRRRAAPAGRAAGPVGLARRRPRSRGQAGSGLPSLSRPALWSLSARPAVWARGPGGATGAARLPAGRSRDRSSGRVLGVPAGGAARLHGDLRAAWTARRAPPVGGAGHGVVPGRRRWRSGVQRSGCPEVAEVVVRRRGDRRARVVYEDEGALVDDPTVYRLAWDHGMLWMGWQSSSEVGQAAGVRRVTFGGRARCAFDARVFATPESVPEDWAFTGGRLYYVLREPDARYSLRQRTDPRPTTQRWPATESRRC